MGGLVTLKCDRQMLQSLLDRELEPELAKKANRHLAECRECRQELSRLKLIWLELEQVEEIVVPPEISFLRQQAISVAKALSHTPEDEFSYWHTQKLAWEPLAVAITMLPGTQTVGATAKMIGSKVPAALEALGKKGLKAVFRRRSS